MIDTHPVAMLQAQANFPPQSQQLSEDDQRKAIAQYDTIQAEREQVAATRFLAIYDKLLAGFGSNADVLSTHAVDVAGLIVFGYNWKTNRI